MTLFRLAFAFIVLAFVAANPHAQDKLSKDDMQTLSRMARADMAEIEAGKLAQQKA